MRRFITHAVAATGVLYALRSLVVLRGWYRVEPVHTVADPPNVTIVVPARDEERNIERCVRSLLRQSGVKVEVIVVDDRSTDATHAILATLQLEFPALHVIAGSPLPLGWVGKPWACAQGARAARGEWLLFTDADSEHEPHASVSAIACAREAQADALSLMTGQQFGSFAERAILPSILGMIVFACGSLTSLNDPARADRALANGQYLLVSRVAYDALGGHDAVRDKIVEDIEFARRLKADGRFRLLLVDGTELVRVRMYHSFREIWDGFTKNTYLGARGDVRALAAGAIFCSALSIAPPLLAIGAARRRKWGEAAEALAVTAAVIGVAAYSARRLRMPRTLAFFSPIGIAVFAAIMLNSGRRGLTGAGFEWRGRSYGTRSRRPTTLEPNEDA